MISSNVHPRLDLFNFGFGKVMVTLRFHKKLNVVALLRNRDLNNHLLQRNVSTSVKCRSTMNKVPKY